MIWFFLTLTDVASVAPTTPGLEYTLPISQVHYTLPDSQIDYTLPDSGLDFTLREED